MLSCEPPLLSLANLSQMHRIQSRRRKAKCLKREKGLMSLIKGVSHLSRRAKRRLYCKLQLWMWRKRKEKCHFAVYRTRKRACGIRSGSCLSVNTQSQKNKNTAESPLECDTGDSEDMLARQNCLLKRCKTVSLSETFITSSSSQEFVTETNVSAGNVTMPMATILSQETLGQFSETTNPLKCSHTVEPLLSTDSDACGSFTHFKEPRTVVQAKRLEVDRPSGKLTTVPLGQDQAAYRDTDETITSKKTASSQTDAGLKILMKDIHEFLDDFYRKYGSFIPLQKSDVLTHLKKKYNTDFSDRINFILPEVNKYRTAITQKRVPSFRVVYKKHTLTLDDLSTLADQNWLNDQVMNMYGELIMESAHHEVILSAIWTESTMLHHHASMVHFLNSFFHRQLMTKGYDGVKRWTKQVDLFSKSLLLVPIHLEVHWCLVTADMVKKKICLYDSQGNALQKVARNILKYLMTEAKEKKQSAFENGWALSFSEKIPQQTNENDCGVFVLEYSRCLALGKPLQFSQNDIPKMRKRIYKELCDCKLHERG